MDLFRYLNSSGKSASVTPTVASTTSNSKDESSVNAPETLLANPLTIRNEDRELLNRAYELALMEKALDDKKRSENALREVNERIQLKRKQEIEYNAAHRLCTEILTRSRGPNDTMICGRKASLRAIPGEKEHRVVCSDHIAIIRRRLERDEKKANGTYRKKRRAESDSDNDITSSDDDAEEEVREISKSKSRKMTHPPRRVPVDPF